MTTVDEKVLEAYDDRAVMRCLYRGEVPESLLEFAGREAGAWERVCAELFESQIATLFFSFLKRSGHERLLPLSMLDKFRKKCEATLAANILIQEQFLRLETMMRDGGILITPLKGLELIEEVYDDLSARSMADIDLLVSDSQRVEAIGLLKSNGYKCIFDNLVEGAENFGSGFQFYGDVSRQTQIELHWNVMDSAAVRMNMMSQRQSRSLSRLFTDSRKERMYRGRKVSMLTPEHFLLSMIVHIYSHNFSGEKWFWDLPLFLDRKSGDVNWEVFFEVVSRYRLDKIVHSGFLFAERALGMPFIPEAVRSRFAGLPGTQRWVCERISTCERANVRLFLNLFLHTSVVRMLMTVVRYFFPTRRQLELTACERVRWRDYPRVFLRLRTDKIFRS